MLYEVITDRREAREGHGAEQGSVDRPIPLHERVLRLPRGGLESVLRRRVLPYLRAQQADGGGKGSVQAAVGHAARYGRARRLPGRRAQIRGHGAFSPQGDRRIREESGVRPQAIRRRREWALP